MQIWPFFRQLRPFVEKDYEFRPIQDNLLRADGKYWRLKEILA
jgi:hypothetical protein